MGLDEEVDEEVDEFFTVNVVAGDSLHCFCSGCESRVHMNEGCVIKYSW